MIDFLKSFFHRKGHIVYSSTIISKIIGFAISVFVIRYISKTEFGYITYAKTILFFITPFIGFGLQNSLLRYGSIAERQCIKKEYFQYSLKFGFLFSLFLVLLLFILSPFITKNIIGANYYLKLLSFSLLSLAFYNIYLSYLRINNLNKGYSIVNVYYSITSFLIAIILTYFYKGTGFVISTVIVPLVIFIYFYGKKFTKNIKNLVSIKFNRKKNKDYINYGLLIGIGSIASQISLMTDNILIGNIIENPDLLAVYRTGSIIPFNLFFIPAVFMTTDFVKIASESENDNYLKKYYINYLKVFGIICIFLIGGIYLFSNEIVTILFSNKYIDSFEILRILLIGLVGAFLLRIPLGNILNAVGKAKWNTYNAYFMLIFNLTISYFLILKYGIIGAAIATSIMLWVSGLISLGLFIYYLKILNKNQEIIIAKDK